MLVQRWASVADGGHHRNDNVAGLLGWQRYCFTSVAKHHANIVTEGRPNESKMAAITVTQSLTTRGISQIIKVTVKNSH